MKFVKSVHGRNLGPRPLVKKLITNSSPIKPRSNVNGTDALILIQIQISILGAILDRHRPILARHFQPAMWTYTCFHVCQSRESNLI